MFHPFCCTQPSSSKPKMVVVIGANPEDFDVVSMLPFVVASVFAGAFASAIGVGGVFLCPILILMNTDPSVAAISLVTHKH